MAEKCSPPLTVSNIYVTNLQKIFFTLVRCVLYKSNCNGSEKLEKVTNLIYPNQNIIIHYKITILKYMQLRESARK